MIAIGSALFLLAFPPAFPRQAPACYDVPLEELELGPGALLPHYSGFAPWEGWALEGTAFPWAVLDGPGEVVFAAGGADAFWTERPKHELGELFVRTDAARDLAGTLFLPKASGEGFLRLPFRIPAARATSNETDFACAELQHYRRLLQSRVPGGAWFRHRLDELRARVGPKLASGTEPANWRPADEFQELSQALELFGGGRALYENLQLERGLPASDPGTQDVVLDSLEGLTVRAIDWKPLLAPGETKLDPLAALIPADQYALFFPSFGGLTAVLDEADRLGEFGLALFEDRSADAHTKERTERQLCLELSAVSRTLGPLVIESVAITGSDPYLRSGSDLALLFRAKTPEPLKTYLALRQDGACAGDVKPVQGTIAGVAYRGALSPTRSVSSYLAQVGDVVVVANSLLQLERVLQTAAHGPALTASDELRFFRQRYALGAEGESGFFLLPDAAIRRWCSPRWRIASARIAHAAAELAELHAVHLADLLRDPLEPRELGPEVDFPDLGSLRLTPAGVHSPTYGTLDFLTPIAELPLERVTQREARLYRTWREGYQQAWSNFFDPIGARLVVSAGKTAVDLSIRPLILGTEYADLRAATRGAGLTAASGDPHPDALIYLCLSLDREWETLKTIGQSLGPAAKALGADPLGWLGDWAALSVDEAPLWDDVLESEGAQEALRALGEAPNEIPLVLSIAVASPVKLALFLTSLRAFVDGTAPGMTEWKDRSVGERRFVQIGSPGLGEDYSLFYATTPEALLLSLNEATLLAAMERQEQRRAGQTPSSSPWVGQHAGLELSRRGLKLLELALEGDQQGLRRQSWRNLPILNEWKRLFPERDPLELQRQVFHEELECPGGGRYVWNADWHTMESSVFGHPGAPKDGARRPPAWEDLERVRFSLTFEDDGLRVRAEFERK